MQVLDATSVNEQQSFGLMMNADVLVTTGSSFGYTAGALVVAGRQIHLAMPPKELGLHQVTGESTSINERKTNVTTYDEIRRHESYRTYFVRRNMVPLDYEGNVFPEYHFKLNGMMRGLDTHGIADEAVAGLAYETWL